MAFGSANYEKGFKKQNYFSLEDGSKVFRILPSVGKLADKGVWSRYYSVHFGYKNMAGKLRTFLSTEIKNNKTKMIEQNDPALDRINMLKAQLEAAIVAGNQPLIARLNALVGQKGVYNIDRNHHVNAIEMTTGKIGLLKMRHKCKVALDAEIARLKKEDNCDPLSVDNGRWLTFTRTGRGNETNFKVDEYKEKQEVAGLGKVAVTVVHKLTPDMEADCADLDDLFEELTVEQVQEIVDTSDLLTGKSPACDKYFDNRWKAEREAAENAENQEPEGDYQSPTQEPRQAAPAAAPAAAPVSAASPAQSAAPITTQPQTPVAAQTAAPTAAAAQAANLTAPVTPAATSVAQETKAALATPAAGTVVDDLNDAAFYAMIGQKPPVVPAEVK